MPEHGFKQVAGAAVVQELAVAADRFVALSLNYDHGCATAPGVQVRLVAGSPKESQRTHLNPGFKVVSHASSPRRMHAADRTFVEHEEILAALAARDPDRARLRMGMHLLRLEDAFTGPRAADASVAPTVDLGTGI